MQFVDIHSHIKNTDAVQILDIATDKIKAVDAEFFSTGIHPKLFDVATLEKDFDIVELLCGYKNCVAVGETGLDRSVDNFEMQTKIFERQISIAKKYSKPLIVHCVRAYNDVLFYVKKHNFKNPVVFHCYNANIQTTQSLLKYPQFYFSFSDRFLSMPKNIEQIKAISIERLFVETDNNSESCLSSIMDIVAMLKGLEMKNLLNQMHKNFEKIKNSGLNF